MSNVDAVLALLTRKVSKQEVKRNLRRNGFDVQKAVEQLKAKHDWQDLHNLEDVDIGDCFEEMRKGYVQLLEDATDHEGRPIVICRRYLFRPSPLNSKADVTIHSATGMMQGVSHLTDVLKVMEYVMRKATKRMDKARVEGIVFLVDMENADSYCFDTGVDRAIAKCLRDMYPETVRHIFIANEGTVVKGIRKVTMSKGVAKSISSKITILPSDKEKALDELKKHIPERHIPDEFGGFYKVKDAHKAVKKAAKKEGVDLTKAGGNKKARKFSKDGMELMNGMQYAGNGVDAVIDHNVRIRGPIWRKDKDAKSGMFDRMWKKYYAVLRPEALLLYEKLDSSNPYHIVPCARCEVELMYKGDCPRKTLPFTLLTMDKRQHIFAANNDNDRRAWLHEIAEAAKRLREMQEGKYNRDNEAYDDEAAMNANLLDFGGDTSPETSPKASGRRGSEGGDDNDDLLGGLFEPVAEQSKVGGAGRSGGPSKNVQNAITDAFAGMTVNNNSQRMRNNSGMNRGGSGGGFSNRRAGSTGSAGGGRRMSGGNVNYGNNNMGGGNMTNMGGGNMNNVSGGNVNNMRGGNMNNMGGGNMNNMGGGNMNNMGGGNMNSMGGG
eukprot:g875.t1